MNRQSHDGSYQALGDRAEASEELTPAELNEDLASDLESAVDEELASVPTEEPALDTINHYLQEIGRVALLSAAEEVELAPSRCRRKPAVPYVASVPPPPV